MPSCKNASTEVQLKFITSIRIASAASAQSHPFRRGRLHDRNPADARRREESARATPPAADGRCFLRSAVPSLEKWRCLQGIRVLRDLPRLTCAAIAQAFFAQPRERRARRSALFSFGSSGSTAPSFCRLPSRPSHPIGSSRAPSSLGARKIPEAAAPRAPHSAGSKSSLALLTSTSKLPQEPQSRSLTPRRFFLW